MNVARRELPEQLPPDADRNGPKYADLAEVLADENLSLLADITRLKEVIRACLDRLHVSHVNSLKAAERYGRLVQALGRKRRLQGA